MVGGSKMAAILHVTCSKKAAEDYVVWNCKMAVKYYVVY